MSREIENYVVNLTVEPRAAEPLFFTKLEDEFYSDISNELTSETLDELFHFSKKIILPEHFGTYKDEAHYAQTLELMLRSTKETQRRGAFLKRMVLPILKTKDKLLDIGPGDGQITSWIGNHFNHITAIDSNQEILDALNAHQELLAPSITLEKIHKSALDVSLPQNHYDLALLSQLLYYIDNARWLEVVERTYEAIKPEGIVVIALSGDRFDKADLIQHFEGGIVDINTLAEKCVSTFGRKNIEMYDSKELIVTQGLLPMLHIAGFFLYDGAALASREELTDYVSKHYKQSGDRYAMSSNQKFILIRKPGHHEK